jgi:hypothetical protein
MKRKPIEIMVDIINNLTSYPENSVVGVAELSRNSKIHYNTMIDYLKLLSIIQTFCPPLEYEISTKQITIRQLCPGFLQLNDEEYLIVYLFLHKIFDYQSAIEINQIQRFSKELSNDVYDKMKQSQSIQVISINDDPFHSRLFLKRFGMLKAQGLLAKINQIMGSYVDEDETATIEPHAPKITAPSPPGYRQMRYELNSEDPLENPKILSNTCQIITPQTHDQLPSIQPIGVTNELQSSSSLA